MEFSTCYWSNHKKGKQTRAEILSRLKDKPGMTLSETAQEINKSVSWTRRQLQELTVEGEIFRREEKFFLVVRVA